MYEAWTMNPSTWCVDARVRITGNERGRLVSRHRKAARALAVMGRTVGVWRVVKGQDDQQLSQMDLEILAQQETS